MSRNRFAVLWTAAGFIELHLVAAAINLVDGVARIGYSPLEGLLILPYSLVYLAISAAVAAPLAWIAFRMWLRLMRSHPWLEASRLRKVASLSGLTLAFTIVLALGSSWESVVDPSLLAGLPKQLGELIPIIAPWAGVAILAPRFTIPVLRVASDPSAADDRPLAA